jgi:Uma2 family endonuclease
LIVTEIGLYLMQYPIGQVAIKALHRPKDDLHNDRIPDVSYVSGTDPAIEDVGAALYMPDMCVEVQLPDQTRKFLRHKAEYYIKNNTCLVWLVYPRQQIIEVWTATEQLILKLEDTLTSGDVLPGFAVPVKRFFV